MSAPGLSDKLKTYLADWQRREHHALWHYVRMLWPVTPPDRKKALAAMQWEPPRLRTDYGAGVDFLAMHRTMLREVQALVQHFHLPDDITGWTEIPWDPNDQDWPMPPAYPRMPDPEFKQLEITQRFSAQVKNQFCSDDWLRNCSLDYLGSQIENTIHDWMHVHWSEAPWFTWGSGKDINDPKNDWLASPYSSHVNKHFWKIHGWIDARITQWEAAKQESATPLLTEAWIGPPHRMGHKPMMTEDEVRAAEAAFAMVTNNFAQFV
jgi:hypothetical protein